MTSRCRVVAFLAAVLGFMLFPAAGSYAQHGHSGGRHHGSGYGGGHRGGYYGGHHAGGHYSGHNRGHYGFYRPHFGFGLFGGYYPYQGYGYYGYPYAYLYGGGWPYYGYRGYGYDYDDRGAVRLRVQPEDTRVFVDGDYAGTVDDFDGSFQRLRLPPGRHEIALKLEGYATHRIHAYVASDHTIEIRHRMLPGSGEDERGDLDRDVGAYDEALRGQRGGALRLSVRPGDAVVYVDGQFSGAGRQVLDLPPGRHRIEVVRPGFRTFERTIEVEDDRAGRLDVQLEPFGS